jgi:hypothetical protein
LILTGIVTANFHNDPLLWLHLGHVIYNPAYTYKFQLKTTLGLPQLCNGKKADVLDLKVGILIVKSFTVRAPLYPAVCILFTHFLKSKNIFSRGFFFKFWPYVWLVFKSGFKSRAGYSGARTVCIQKIYYSDKYPIHHSSNKENSKQKFIKP